MSSTIWDQVNVARVVTWTLSPEIPPAFKTKMTCLIETINYDRDHSYGNIYLTNGVKLYKRLNSCMYGETIDAEVIENEFEETRYRINNMKNEYASLKWQLAGTTTILDLKQLIKDRCDRFTQVMTCVSYCLGYQEVYKCQQAQKSIKQILIKHSHLLRNEIEEETKKLKFDQSVSLDNLVSTVRNSLESILSIQQLQLQKHQLYRNITLLVWEYCDVEYITFCLEPPARTTWTQTRTSYYYASHRN